MNDEAPAETRAWALVKLLELHRCEVVQISRHESQWKLEDGPCPKPPSQQFRCEPEAQPLARKCSKTKKQSSLEDADKYQIQQEYGRTDAPEIRTAAEERGVLAGFAGTKNMADAGVPFVPDWGRQTYLCVVPCRARDDGRWRREMLCSTLGDMFRVLGKEHSVDTIYYFYQSMKIVARKLSESDRRKSGGRGC